MTLLHICFLAQSKLYLKEILMKTSLDKIHIQLIESLLTASHCGRHFHIHYHI